MSLTFHIRLVEEKDVPQVLAIYAPFILETTTSFETEVPDIEVFKERVRRYSSTAPWLVAVDGEEVLGYAYATAHRSRGAYRWNQETTVYVHPNHRKKGIARALYSKLLELLRVMGYTKALGIITLPNDPSVGFHSSMGFKHIGDMEKIGYKFDAWHTTSWWSLDLQEDGFTPGEVKSVESIRPLVS